MSADDLIRQLREQHGAEKIRYYDDPPYVRLAWEAGGKRHYAYGPSLVAALRVALEEST